MKSRLLLLIMSALTLVLYSAPAPGAAVTATKAKVYLGADDDFTVSNSGMTVYGSFGIEAVTIAAEVTSVNLDQNIDRINFSGAAGSYAFKQTGNKINIYDATGSSLLASAPIQGDSDGTLLGFSDGTASALLSGGVMSVGGATVSSTVASVIAPALQQLPAPATLFTPADNGELERWLKAELVKSYQTRDTRYYYATMGGKIAIPLSDLPATATAASQPTATGSTSSYSTTNVQVKGVDEGDLVKTDGNHIYLARGSRFLVLKGQPVQQAAVVSNIDLAETINELYLADGRVTVITAPYNLASTTPAVSLLAGTSGEMVAFPVSGEDFAATGSIVPWIPTTRVYNYDVSNPAKPILLSRFDFPGSLLGSRRINNSMYLIINHHIDLPAAVSIGDYLPAGNSTPELYRKASEMAFAENLRRIDIMTLGDMIPSYSRIIYNEGRAGTAVKNQVVESNDIYIPTSGNGTDLTMVIVLDTATAPPVVTSSGVVSASSQMYMSPESLYLASSNSWAWIQPVRDMLLPAGNPEPWTALHKFALGNGASKPLYKGSGLVAGWVNNQFSMGEHNSYLRIGTTRGGWWGEKISNRLAIFAEQNGSLSEKGHIEGLAEGEKIYSMRFDKNRGYMVTFRQTDPLFTFDLSDPQNPKKIGELKVNGFATYIHLVGQDNNRLLTVGRSADAAGRVTGNKLQLFDVTDLYSPALLGDVELGDGWSDALYDHHAFLYYDPLGILAIPYYKYGSTADRYSSGLRVFTVTGNGISERGMITAQAVSYGYGTYNDTVDRSIIIGTDIYAIAHRTVTIAGSELLDIKNIVGLPEGYGYYALPVSTGKISPDQ